MSHVHVEEVNRSTAPRAPSEGFLSLTLVGSGVSTGVPVIGHLNAGCACEDAVRHPAGPNCRNNVSLLITVPTTDSTAPTDTPDATGETAAPVKLTHDSFVMPTVNTMNGKPVRCVLIDCGKTFRAAYFHVLVHHHVRIVDALFLTHDHADAIAGLDDMRDVQAMHMERETGHWVIDQYIPTYLTPKTLRSLEGSAGYILRNSHVLGAAPNTAQGHAHSIDMAKAKVATDESHEGRVTVWNDIGIRRSTALQVFTVPEEVPASVYVPALNTSPTTTTTTVDGGDAATFPFYTVPVEHGKDYISLGFVFGRGTAFLSDGATRDTVDGKSCVAYISDVTDIPTASMAFLQNLVKIDVLYVDMLHGPGMHSNVHYCMDDVVELVVQLKPRKVYCIGMYCDVEHEAGNALWASRLDQLRSEGRLSQDEVESVQLGYDGMELVLPQ